MRSLRIDLTSDDLARPRLVVSISLQGTGATTVCESRDGIGAVVEIETTTALHLVLDRALETPRDLLAAWGGRARLAWDGTAGRLAEAARVTRGGVPADLVAEGGLDGADGGLTLDALQDAAAVAERPLHGWDPAFSADTNPYGIRRFHNAQTWRLRYDLRDGRSLALPGALDLALFLGRHPAGADWQVSVTLNDRLVAFETVAADAPGPLRLRIDLPTEAAGHAQTLEVTASSAFLHEGICNDGPELVAEILPETRLVASGETLADPVRDLTEALAAQTLVGLALDPGLSLAEANVAVDLLAAVLPERPVADAPSASAALEILPRGADLPPGDPEGTWAVYRDPSDQVLVAEPLGDVPGGRTEAPTLLVHTGRVGS